MSVTPTIDPRVLRSMRRVVPVAVVALLAVAVGRAIAERDAFGGARHVLLAVGVAVLLATTLLLGSTVRRGAPVWFAGLVAFWGAATLVSEGFVWLAFPLYFLLLSHLRGRVGVAAAVGVAVWTPLSAVARQRIWGRDAVGSVGVGSWLGPLMGLAFAVLAYAVYAQLRADARNQRELASRLQRAQAELALTEHTNGVLAERERLARELHDTVGQGLGSIIVLTRTARSEYPAATEALQAIEDTARDNLAEVRSLVRGLHHGSEAGLEEGLRALARSTGERERAAGHELVVDVRVDGSPACALTPESRSALYRCVQGSLANVVEHARASRCVVGLSWLPDRVCVDVIDDGVGFDPSTLPDAPGGDDGTRGYGIPGVRERMAQVGGSVVLEAAPGEGTTVALTIPCPAAGQTMGVGA